VDRLLGRAGFETYLPLVERERQWADRKKKVEFPLFAGYTFARFPTERFLDVVRTPGVVTVVGGREEPTPVREEELEAVRRFTQGIRDTGWSRSPWTGGARHPGAGGGRPLQGDAGPPAGVPGP
jgi:transcription antitermination factor NusG